MEWIVGGTLSAVLLVGLVLSWIGERNHTKKVKQQTMELNRLIEEAEEETFQAYKKRLESEAQVEELKQQLKEEYQILEPSNVVQLDDWRNKKKHG